jgi:hypothetical protein
VITHVSTLGLAYNLFFLFHVPFTKVDYEIPIVIVKILIVIFANRLISVLCDL